MKGLANVYNFHMFSFSKFLKVEEKKVFFGHVNDF